VNGVKGVKTGVKGEKTRPCRLAGVATLSCLIGDGCIEICESMFSNTVSESRIIDTSGLAADTECERLVRSQNKGRRRMTKEMISV